MARRKTEDKPSTETKDDDLSLVLAQFIDSQDTTITSRAEAELHRAYYDGVQWTDEEVAALEARGQPVITDNKIKDKVEYLLGLERKTRTDPKAYPRNTPTDEAGAEAATDALRYVADANMFPYVRSDVAENMFIEGVGGIEIVIDKKYGGKSPKICLRKIRWDRGYADPHSMECDYSDAGYKGFVTWMDLSTAEARWPGKKTILGECFNAASMPSETTDDKPRFVVNTTNRKRVQVFTHYYKRAEVWHHCVFVKGGFLEEPTKSVYEDEHGEPECPLEFQALYRQGDDGAPYGAIRRYKDLQDEWNKRRSKSTHLLMSNQIEGETGAFEDIEKTRAEAARPDGIILRTQGMAGEIKRNLDLSQGHIQLMAMTGAALEATGPNAALTGDSGSISGRAKQIDQQGGSIGLDKTFDSVRYLTLRVYRQVWNRIKQYWTMETWIRVRDEEQIKFVGLNRPKTRGEVLAEELKTRADIPEEEKAAILQGIAADPQSRTIVGSYNNVAEMDMDITIDESPDVVTLQQEQFETLGKLAERGIPIPPKVLIQASALRDKRKLIEMMSGGDDPAAQQMAAMQQRMADLDLKLKGMEVMLKEAQARKVMSEVEKNKETSAETHVDTAVKVAEFTDPATGQAAQPASKTTVSVN